nr:MAG TPA: hypothetical protein [Caudoviricetes sp.]
MSINSSTLSTPAASFPIKSLASRIPFSYTVFTGSCLYKNHSAERRFSCYF